MELTTWNKEARLLTKKTLVKKRQMMIEDHNNC